MPDHPEIYRKYADQYEALVSREDYQHNIFSTLNRIVPFDAKIVVELGAGTGRLTCLLAPVVKFIYAFDRSQPMLDVAAAKLRQGDSQNWQVAIGDHRQIALPNNLGDVAISGWSICYIVVENKETWEEELAKVLQEMRRVIRPGGMFILLETLGTGYEQPEAPVDLRPYYAYLEARGFKRMWIRTDYKFRDFAEAETLSQFFFGETIVEKIRQDERGIILPECTGIWWLQHTGE